MEVSPSAKDPDTDGLMYGWHHGEAFTLPYPFIRNYALRLLCWHFCLSRIDAVKVERLAAPAVALREGRDPKPLTYSEKTAAL